MNLSTSFREPPFSMKISPFWSKYIYSVICQILEGVCAKNLEATLLFVDFSKVFDSIHRGKMEQILLAYGLSRKTVTAIMMPYKNTIVKVCLSDGDAFFFDIVAGVLQGETLALYLFRICLDYLLPMLIDLMKENGLTLEKSRSLIMASNRLIYIHLLKE